VRSTGGGPDGAGEPTGLLATASLHHLSNGADAETVRERANFYLSRLPRLTARPEQILALRQAILNLGVRVNSFHKTPPRSLIRTNQAHQRGEGAVHKNWNDFSAEGANNQGIQLSWDSLGRRIGRPQAWGVIILVDVLQPSR